MKKLSASKSFMLPYNFGPYFLTVFSFAAAALPLSAFLIRREYQGFSYLVNGISLLLCLCVFLQLQCCCKLLF